MPQTRRGLLKKTMGGAALLAAAGAVPLALRKTKLREAPKGLLFFTPAEYSIWAAVADRVLAEEKPTGAPTAAQMDVAAKADVFLAPLPAPDRKDLKQLLTDAVPTLEGHLQHAKNVQAQLGAKAAK